MEKVIDGVSVHYIQTESKGNKVLLLHGWGCDGSLMNSISDSLRIDHEILIPDFPGHGKSGKPPVPWGVPDYAENLVKLMKETGFSHCDVIAHSFGCRIATWIAVNHPEMFRKIIFTGAAGIRPKQSEQSRKKSAQYQKMKKIVEKSRKIPFFNTVADLMEEKLRQKYGSRDYNALDEEMRKTFVKVINLDLSEQYDKFQQSTLLIWGDADTETPIWMAKEIEKRIPDCGLVILEGGSHFAYLEQRERFNKIARFFLTEG